MHEYQYEMSKDDMEETFQEIFVPKYGMLERRFDEQTKTGDIIFEDENAS